MSRAVMSLVLPGSNGTITRTGRVGFACAHAIRDTVGSQELMAGKFHDLPAPEKFSRERFGARKRPPR
jgi:hypothetical protein